MTQVQILADLKAGKLTPEEAGKLLDGLTQTKRNALHVSRNKAGGVFIRHPLFIEHSTNKDKDYTAGINLPPNVAKVLFSNKAVFDEIAKAVNALTA